MMTTEQKQNEFLERYDSIISSGDKEQMECLGAMVKRTMRWLIANEPEIADQAIDMLDGNTGDCKNTLTREEAERLSERMDPKPAWTLKQLDEILGSMKLPTSEAPYYNKWALLTTMLMIQSDSGDTLKRILHAGDKDDRLTTAIYKLSLDKLKDKDGVFDIRSYFGIK